jgi:tetrahydromethanopterin S-methyltransferase subunit B
MTTSGDPREVTVLAIQGFLEWFFVGLLVALVGVVGLFALYLVAQLVRNPGRAPKRRRA